MNVENHYIKEVDPRGVVTITLNRPEIHNAFNDQIINDLTREFQSLDSDDSCRMVVLTGAGKSFCAGADLNWMKGMANYSDDENIEDSRRLSGLFETINKCRKPVLAKVNGAALGGGTGLIACCDFVMACKSAKFGFTEVRLGLLPAVISPFVMAKIGESNARAWFLSGERFDATVALQIGLVHQVVPLDDLETSMSRMIEKFLLAGPMAACEAKKLVMNVLKFKNENPSEVTEYTCQTISRIRTSPEGREGMGALLEKRKPNWVES